MNECIPKQTMYNSASNNKAWVSRSEMGHSSPFRICLLSEVRFWDAYGLYQADGLRLLVLFQNFLTASRRFRLSPNILMDLFFCHLFTCALDTGPLRAKDLQCVAVKKNCFGSFWIEIHDVLHHKCLVTWILWIGRDWGSEPRRFWYLICRKENKSCFNQISLYPGWIIFL